MDNIGIELSSINSIESGQCYAASVRASLLNFVKIYTNEFTPKGIRMINVLCGYMENWEIDEETINTVPKRRAGKLTEIAKSVAFLPSDDAGYITGQNVRIDGGITKSI